MHCPHCGEWCAKNKDGFSSCKKCEWVEGQGKKAPAPEPEPVVIDDRPKKKGK